MAVSSFSAGFSTATSGRKYCDLPVGLFIAWGETGGVPFQGPLRKNHPGEAGVRRIGVRCFCAGKGRRGEIELHHHPEIPPAPPMPNSMPPSLFLKGFGRGGSCQKTKKSLRPGRNIYYPALVFSNGVACRRSGTHFGIWKFSTASTTGRLVISHRVYVQQRDTPRNFSTAPSG